MNYEFARAWVVRSTVKKKKSYFTQLHHFCANSFVLFLHIATLQHSFKRALIETFTQEKACGIGCCGNTYIA